ncbi:MAG: 2-phospho-L-lactate/phosphoenolpyruvate guanylyltransferase [Solirubrobacteraceae bacterium]|jgi:2-phospho-L-lactate guanylyltransferase|nr:2-phospho-L-lactate/phosphoenolpyruvate guanylyltransferase [Solirubrobacteraceae bacterium]
MRTIAILPVKRFGAAKQRLTDGLAPAAREVLAEAMVRDVLDALRGVRGLDGIVVVTNEPRAAEPAREAGAEVVADPSETGQSPAARVGIAHGVESGAGRVLLVPGDCPALDAREVEALLSPPADGPTVTIVPDRHGTGTNALLLTPPHVIDPAFGEGSFARHTAAARDAEAHLTVERPASLLLDVDTAGDLAAIRQALHPGLHTTTALAEIASGV